MSKHKSKSGSAPWTLGMRIIAVAIVVAAIVVIVTL